MSSEAKSGGFGPFVEAYRRVMQPKQLQSLAQKLGGIGSFEELELMLLPDKEMSWIQEDIRDARGMLDYVLPVDAQRPWMREGKLRYFTTGGYLSEWLIRTAFAETEDEGLLKQVKFEIETDPGASAPLCAHQSAERVKDMGEKGYERALPCGLILERYMGLLNARRGTDVEQYLLQGFGFPFELVGQHADTIVDEERAFAPSLDEELATLLGNG